MLHLYTRHSRYTRCHNTDDDIYHNQCWMYIVQSSSRLPPPQTNGECLWPFNKRSGVALSRYIVHTLPWSTCNIVSIQGWILSPQPLLSSVTPEVQLWQEPRHAEPEPPGGAGRGHGRGRGDQRRSRWRPGPASPSPPAPATARHQQEQVRPQDAAGPVTRKCFTFHSKTFDAKTKNIFCHSISPENLNFYPFVCHFLLTYNKNLQICLKVATFLGLFVRQAGFPLYRVWMRQNLFIFPPFSNILTIKCFYLYQKFILTVKQKLLSHKTTSTSTFNYRTFLLPQHKTSHWIP